MIYWEDISPGRTFETASITISREEILEFAAEFDPQPFHLNSQAADDSIFGGLCASGWHICALMMRLMADTFKREGLASMGSPGVPELRWRKPVFAEDTLKGTFKVSECRESKSNPAMGLMELEVAVCNQEDKTVIEMTSTMMVARK
ncbi:MaoC family dehydratase [Pseudomaricurvus alkylphenolicus]|jgi:acyl dehydratase|uniref:MaoC family dehydratase n=1 Tax=Pseudomaricurvus alkylphenolicus TaxID=1306991 RepID=UPI00141E6C77|nr:MaoC family dehydratase [Pseudomaricurvus alkylphenolicus]NIB40358.1 MaoC family dehydratase [Pseudomaricurvus alkylphenolicus]